MNHASFFYDTFPTPLGDFSIAVNASGAVAATAFGGREELRARFPASMRRAGFTLDLERDAARVEKPRRQTLEFLAGRRRDFDVPLEPVGTAFQQSVWAALRDIPFGETRSYGALAEALGNAGAARAIGRANGTNPISLFIPCHRVIGRDGSLTGYAFGEELKRKLLKIEGVTIRR